MHAMQPVLTALRANRSMTPAYLVGVAEERMADQFGTMTNHAAWQLGHITSGLGFAAGLAGADFTLPEGWREKYGHGSTPNPDRAAYPASAELLDMLERVSAALEARLLQLDDATLDAPFPIEAYRKVWPTVGDGIAYLVSPHWAFHIGQLSGWRRALGLGSALSM